MEFSWLVSVTFGILMLTAVSFANAQQGPPRFYNVWDYGAVSDGKTDNSQAFLRAWSEACEWKGRSRVLIPWGIYMLHSLIFKGPCTGEIGVVIQGMLRAPTDPNLFFIDHWIGFQYVDGLVVKGGGYLDAQGSSAWHYNDCFTNPHCKPLPVTMRFDFVNNARVHHLTSINSKNTHFSLFACNNINIHHIRITAPGRSLNTDGIRIGASKNIKIYRTIIGTGDDCISMVSGSQNIHISNVDCGPGHGISVGSLGKAPNEAYVTGVTIRNCSFTSTQNGVRIKTWAQSYPTVAANFVFEDIEMKNVNNPVIIDQQYCPQGNCGSNDNSAVQIRNVTFRNIWGTSNSKDALVLKCSASVPCRDVKLMDINLSYDGPGGPATSSCINVQDDDESSLRNERGLAILCTIFSLGSFLELKQINAGKR